MDYVTTWDAMQRANIAASIQQGRVTSPRRCQHIRAPALRWLAAETWNVSAELIVFSGGKFFVHCNRQIAVLFRNLARAAY